MNATVSFHPVDVAFFDDLIGPLLRGEKIDPGQFLDQARRMRRAANEASKYALALQSAVELDTPLGPDPADSLWGKMRSRLETMTHRPSDLAERIGKLYDPELHLHGRPFFITEGSAERVADLVQDYLDAADGQAADAIALEQLVRLDPELARQLEPDDPPDISADLAYRSELLDALKRFFDIAQAARAGENWGRAGEPRKPAQAVIRESLTWGAIAVHSRIRPMWVARDVDGLETICRAAGVEPPGFLVTARRLLGGVDEICPDFGEGMTLELEHDRDVGALVLPADVRSLLDYLNTSGSRIISAAAKFGEGGTARTLLRKIRECAVFAERNGFGYVEASGILPPDRQEVPLL